MTRALSCLTALPQMLLESAQALRAESAATEIEGRDEPAPRRYTMVEAVTERHLEEWTRNRTVFDGDLEMNR